MVEEESIYDGPSRSAKKRAARGVEDLVWQLLELSATQVEKLPVPQDLRAELTKARQIKVHGARKRQAKYLAGLLRRDEEIVEAIRGYVDSLHQVHLQEQQVFHELEALRDRLCDVSQSSEALREAGERFPSLDAAHVSRLAAQFHAGGDKRPYREIFKLLREASRKQGL